MVEIRISYDFCSTVMTPNKGQLIFHEIRSNKGIFGILLFAIFRKFWEIRDFLLDTL